MSISAISGGAGSLNIGFSASIQGAGVSQLASSLQGTQDPGAAALSVIAGSQGGFGSSSSVNNVNGLATALLLGALSSQNEDKKKGDSLAGAALALLAYGAIANLGQSGGSSSLPGDVLTSTAASAVSFSTKA
jgi:hypothetical protein